MSQSNDDQKQEAILTSAWNAFSSYGFQKTSMDDIARGAGMSRPAVYLHFRNKQEIIRSLARTFYSNALTDMKAVMEGDLDRPLADILLDIFLAQSGPLMEAVMQSKHGLELLDTSVDIALDIIEQGEQDLRDLYAHWLSGMAREGRVRIVGSPEEFGRTLCFSLKGIKHNSTDYATFLASVGQLAALFGAALTVHEGETAINV